MLLKDIFSMSVVYMRENIIIAKYLLHMTQNIIVKKYPFC